MKRIVSFFLVNLFVFASILPLFPLFQFNILASAGMESSALSAETADETANRLNAYYGKIYELEYGLVEYGPSDARSPGLQCAELIDFDNDGIEELVLAYKNIAYDNYGSEYDLKYVFEVWSYQQGLLKKIYEYESYIENRAGVFSCNVSIASKNGKNYIIIEGTTSSTGRGYLQSAEKKGDSFVNTDLSVIYGRDVGSSEDTYYISSNDTTTEVTYEQWLNNYNEISKDVNARRVFYIDMFWNGEGFYDELHEPQDEMNAIKAKVKSLYPDNMSRKLGYAELEDFYENIFFYGGQYYPLFYGISPVCEFDSLTGDVKNLFLHHNIYNNAEIESSYDISQEETLYTYVYDATITDDNLTRWYGAKPTRPLEYAGEGFLNVKELSVRYENGKYIYERLEINADGQAAGLKNDVSLSEVHKLGEEYYSVYGYGYEHWTDSLSYIIADFMPDYEGLYIEPFTAYFQKVNENGEDYWRMLKLAKGFIPEERIRQELVEVRLDISYDEARYYTLSNQFTDSIRGLLKDVETDKIDSESIMSLMRYMEYAVSSLIQTAVRTGADNTVIASTAADLPKTAEELKSLIEEFDALIAEYGLVLAKKIDAVIRINAQGIDFSQPYIVCLDEKLLRDAGDDAEGIYITLNNALNYIYIPMENLENLINKYKTLYIRFSKAAEKDQYDITFADNEKNTLERMDYPISIGLPAPNELATVFVTYMGGNDNWGNQYNPNSGTLEFTTGVSGTYEIIESTPQINDIAELDENMNRIISFMVSKGFFALDENGNFNGDADMSRYQLCTALVRIFFAIDNTLKTTFTDVPSNSVYYPFVASAQSNNIIMGISETEFGGDLPITREAVYALAGRTLVNKRGYSEADGSVLRFSDVNDISDWAVNDVAICVKAGMTDGTGELIPKETLNRKESAKILYELFMLLYETPQMVNLSTEVFPEETKSEDDELQDSPDENVEEGFSLPLVIGGGIAAVSACVGSAAFFRMKKKS